MIPRNILFLVLILIVSSCQSEKAVHLKTVLEQKERVAFNIMLGKNGPNEQKLKCLIAGDFKCAQQAITKEEQAFDKIISEINSLETGDIKYGNELKLATDKYYKAVKEFEVFDRLIIAQQQISQNKTNTEKIRDAAIRQQGQLSRDKLKMRKIINKKEQVLAEVRKQFNLLNRLH
ncbi:MULTISPECIES: hypothetical protein [unclassified Pedobacter]|uniref:hypothetical protein n=1 Tax=unclassified Pedobacter TaxID=2628915 RepID=UPI001D83DB5F|nr:MULTISPECIES: hypothetical protein [unclassified Pedobacter]CAH0168846.1 hypothetical protein SRABI126_00977 [Pedobacter sp. Bi126]CAH0287006.1 hypothetical protein SRABI36_04188 [Pedobacter sp. Bi36]